MKKQFSRITSLLLVLVMLVGIMPIMASAGQITETIFADDFETIDKVWTVHPNYNNVFLTEGNDGTYDYMRLNATVSGKGGGTYSYAVPVTAGGTYTVELVYKSPINPSIYCYSRDNTDVVSGATLGSFNKNIDNGTENWLTRSVDYTVASGATHMNIMVYIGGSSAPSYIDLRSVVIKNKATGEIVENFAMNRGWTYFKAPATDGTHSISYTNTHAYNKTNVINFKTGVDSNGLRSPVIPVTGGESYQITFGYSSHKNTAVQIEYWTESGVSATRWNYTKTSLSGYNGFKSQPAIATTAPAGAKYMTLLFHDQYYNLFLDNVKVEHVITCEHPETDVSVISNGDGTHATKEICKTCGDVLSETSGSCVDSKDADAKCDICGYEPEAIFTDDFENIGKVWSVHPSYNNVFLTEGNDGTYDYMRLNAPVSGKGGGASSYAVPVTAGQTYRVELTYKTSAYLTVYTYSRDNKDVIGGTALHSNNRNIDKGTTSWITRSFTYTVAEGASYMNIMVYFHKDNAPAYADFRKITIKNEATGELVENFKLDRGWNYYTTPATDGTHSINYGKLNSYNTTNVINLKTGAASNGLRSPVIPVTAGEKYYVSFRYSSHKNTQVQIEYWDANGVA